MLKELIVTQECKERESILHVRGDVDAYSAPTLHEQLMSLVMNGKQQKVVVNLEQVHYMDSTGIGVFVFALKASKLTGCQLIIENVTPRVERVFQISGLSDIIPIAPVRGKEA